MGDNLNSKFIQDISNNSFVSLFILMNDDTLLRFEKEQLEVNELSYALKNGPNSVELYLSSKKLNIKLNNVSQEGEKYIIYYYIVRGKDNSKINDINFRIECIKKYISLYKNKKILSFRFPRKVIINSKNGLFNEDDYNHYCKATYYFENTHRISITYVTTSIHYNMILYNVEDDSYVFINDLVIDRNNNYFYDQENGGRYYYQINNVDDPIELEKGLYSLNGTDRNNYYVLYYYETEYAMSRSEFFINFNKIILNYLDDLDGKNSLNKYDKKYLQYYYNSSLLNPYFENRHVFSKTTLKKLLCYTNSDLKKICENTSYNTSPKSIILVLNDYSLLYCIVETIYSPLTITLKHSGGEFTIQFQSKIMVPANKNMVSKYTFSSEKFFLLTDDEYKNIYIKPLMFLPASSMDLTGIKKLCDEDLSNFTNYKLMSIKSLIGNNLLISYPQFYDFFLNDVLKPVSRDYKIKVVNFQNSDGNTVLHNFIINDYKFDNFDFDDFYSKLFVNGFDTSLKNNYGQTILDLPQLTQEQRNIIISRNNMNILFIEEIRNIDYKDWSGTYLQTLASIIYFLEKYKNLSCTLIPKTFVSELVGLTWSCDYSNGKHTFKIFDGFSEVYRDCLNSQSRFIIIPLTLKHQSEEECKKAINTSGDHSNVIIIDKKNKTVDRYEPHGNVSDKKIFFDSENLDNELNKLFTYNKENKLYWTEGEGKDNLEFKQVFKLSNGLIYKKPEDICPEEGLQVYERSGYNPSNQVKKDGFCTAWSLYYTNLRLENPDMNPKMLLYFSEEEIRNYGFNKFINEYSFFLKDKLIEYNKSINQLACRLCIKQATKEEEKERILHTAAINFYQYKLRQYS